jgi:hypothetical protein
VDSLLTTSPAPAISAGERIERAAVLAILAARAGYCLYGAGVVGLNLSSFRSPWLAVSALFVALVSSGGLGAVVLWKRSVSALVAIADTAIGSSVLIAVSIALAPPERVRSLNWALAYAVGCAIWLGFSRRPAMAAVMAAGLSIAYGIGAMSGSSWSDEGLTVTAFVNAISPLVYFTIAWVVFKLVRELAGRTDRMQVLERKQRREAASLRERERLFADVHEPVAAALELVAEEVAPGAEIRRRATSEAISLRHALAVLNDPGGDSGLRGGLVHLVRAAARQGRPVNLTDAEITREPPPAVSETVRTALEALLDSAAVDSNRETWVRAASDERGVQVVVRLHGSLASYGSAIDRAGALLDRVSGLIEEMPLLGDEARLVIRVPA